LDTLIVCNACGKQLQGAQNFCPACGADLRGLGSQSDTLRGSWSGKVIDGRYKVLEKLGDGGMGAVYKVEHVRIEKVLALKLLRPDLALDKGLKQRFMQEAKLVAKLESSNTVHVFDSGEYENGLYIAMEYLAGRDLAWHLRAHGPMAEERAMNIGIQVLSALAEAHAANIVHRDIKPANVMLVRKKDKDEQAKVLDFGIAKLLEAEGRRSITGSAEFVGTPAYMSPEQVRGDSVDARSDIYSVGILLFELVAGRPPFEEKNPIATAKHHLATPLPRVMDFNPGRPISPGFEAILKKALAKEAAERFPDADAMRRELERVRRELGGMSTDFTPLPEEAAEYASRHDFDSFERALRLRRSLLPLGAVAVLLALGFGGFRYWKQNQTGRTVAAASEREPNETPPQATKIALATPVTGSIGAADVGKSDNDVYVVDVPAGRASVTLDGVSDLNLVLQVTQFPPGQEQDAETKKGTFVDDQATNFGERLDALKVQALPLYVRVYEASAFNEAARPPREKARAEYTLVVEAQPDEPLRPVESEPNDTLESAEQSPLQMSLEAWTGAAVEYPPSDNRRVAPSSVDWFYVGAAEEAKVAVLVVPPADGALCVVDGAAWETWAAKHREASVSGKSEPEPKCTLVKGKPQLIPLKPTQGRRLVRLQAHDAEAAGQQYRLAFATDSSNGLAAVLHLMRELETAKQGELAKSAGGLAASHFSGAEQVAELKKLIQ
jgi:eukaryotic-like serine/threonine-protein kinase